MKKFLNRCKSEVGQFQVGGVVAVVCIALLAILVYVVLVQGH
jgi:hypothetical protein